MEIILHILTWYFVGIVGFIFWWTSDWDFTTEEIFLCIMVGILGPITWVLGAFVHGFSNKKTIIKKRHKGL